MAEQTRLEVEVECAGYVSQVLGLDLQAGVPDREIWLDFVCWLSGWLSAGGSSSPVEIWEVFNAQVIEPVYRISVPALPEPEVV